MEKLLEYAPIIIVLVVFLIQHKIFVTPEQLSQTKSELLEHTSDNYVSLQIYRDNRASLENRIEKIDQNVNEVKNLLISIVQRRFTGE